MNAITNKFFVLFSFLCMLLFSKEALAATDSSATICADRLGEACITNAYDAFITRHHNPKELAKARAKCDAEYNHRKREQQQERASASNRAGCMRTLALIDLQNGLSLEQIRSEALEQRRELERARRIRNEQAWRDKGRADVADLMRQERLAAEDRLSNLYHLDYITAPKPRRSTVSSADADKAAAELARIGAERLAEPENKPAALVAAKAEPVLHEKAKQDSLPPELELRSADNERAVLFVRKGAYFMQISNSWLSREYDTSASAVYEANEFKDTFGICETDGKKVFDETRMKVGSTEKAKLDGAPNLQFMQSCKGEFSIALQGFQLLVVPHKKPAQAGMPKEAANTTHGNKSINEAPRPRLAKTGERSEYDQEMTHFLIQNTAVYADSTPFVHYVRPPYWLVSSRLYSARFAPQHGTIHPITNENAGDAREAMIEEAGKRSSAGQDPNKTGPPRVLC